ncbi:Protein kinase-like (PK-like) [Glarea lozoyensis ATCC 20868]|uniref:Protein kinase-like (PK-like) n=1 Tax=Glarea lozoyensis (strain ATCC 20868 / MF5171) TaxID=1116229 RepID=S3EB83_GLAL2|nr:Protein kinase-like (PK-like) [Glarea lozoyensis ATCC 20868]EPE35578.1 Protein kinase-like (PK-like) [Glarea lozoyensis ATCC 20868]
MGSSSSKVPNAKTVTTSQQEVEPDAQCSVPEPEARDDSFSFLLDNLELSSVSDEQLAELFSTAPIIHHYGAVKIVRLSKTLALKGGRGVAPSEARNMKFVTENLSLSAPKVYRDFAADVPGPFDEGLVTGHFIVMDYISGPTVQECWESLDVHQRQSAADQVASMVNTMQSRPLDLPSGPVGATGDLCFEGPWFTEDGAGPFPTLKDLEDWCNHKVDISILFKDIPSDSPRFKFEQLVFTHQDIAPRNNILDVQGKVWMIDWGLAGAYPPGFEQAILHREAKSDKELAQMVLARLSDRQEHVSRQYESIAFGLSRGAHL